MPAKRVASRVPSSTPFTAEAAESPRVSLEFFPPRRAEGDGAGSGIDGVIERLRDLNPAFCSCTYGAGGSTRDGTRETVRRLIELGFNAVPHLSIGTDSESEIGALLDHYRQLGVRRIVALRGDVPSGVGRARLVHNAETLVRWIRAHSGDHFEIEVAAYPETHPDARSPADDLDYFARKVAAGANGAITQYFYNVDAYVDFVERCRRAGINIPIVPGIMPIRNFHQVAGFAAKAGASVPRWVGERFEGLENDPETHALVAATTVVEQVMGLARAGVEEFHFYTNNRADMVFAICHLLGVRPVREKADA